MSSALATSLILHPKLSQVLAVLATTAGRDKAYRLVQYLARLIAWSLLRRGSVEAADRFTGLKAGFTTTRKAMRLFRFPEFLQSAANLSQRPITSLNAPGQVAHIAQIGKQLGMAGYYTFDGLVYLGSLRALRLDKIKLARYQKYAYQFWLSAILLSFASTTASLVKLRADGRRFSLANQVARRETSEKSLEERTREEEERREKGRALLTQRQTLLSQLVMDSCDVWIPATGAGYTNLNDGTIGALGTITSYMALQKLWLKHSLAGQRKKE